MNSEPPDPTVHLVVWSGPVSALAARLRITPSTLIAALRMAGRDVSKSAISLPVDLANSRPVWAAARRRLASAAGGVDSEPGIAAHPLRLSGDV